MVYINLIAHAMTEIFKDVEERAATIVNTEGVPSARKT